MIFDTDAAPFRPPTGHYHVAIAGGGVAGITLATTLAAQGLRVLLLEGGGLTFDPTSQRVYQGRNVGRPYFDLDRSRLRFLGGTSNHWGGWCRPLDGLDFQRRDYIRHSGWPIGKADLDAYTARARDILGLLPVPADRPLGSAGGAFDEIHFNFDPPVRFAKKYGATLQDSQLIETYLNANLVGIDTDPDNGRVRAFQIKGYLPEAPVHRIRAEHYVLALGGIENARLLLNCRRANGTAIGNESDLVGRHFMEHPTYDLGYFAVRPGRFGADEGVRLGGARWRFLAPSAEAQRAWRVASTGLRFVFRCDLAAGPESGAEGIGTTYCPEAILEDLAKATGDRRWSADLAEAGILAVAFEQTPNPDSRVMLDTARDRFGLRRARLDWRFTDFDRQSIRTVARRTAEHFARADLGRIKLFPWVADSQAPLPDVHGGYGAGAGNHHMGTTRMAASPRDGVVDAQGRVFGCDNLYIAGSSVFPTSGHANPTYTIVQLALRLADTLAEASRTRVPISNTP